jgi:uncharacterized protein
MTQRIKRTALITGASGGIGYELAILCAKAGQDLILVARSKDKLQSLKDELIKKYQINVHYYVADLSKTGVAQELFDFVTSQNIHIHYLINNAGFGDYQMVAEADAGLYSEMLQLNIVAVTELTTLFVKPMLADNYGRILNVASTAAYQPVPRLAVYAASKSYVVNFTEALHAELKGTGVTATVLSPGPTDTGFRDRAAMNSAKLGQGGQDNAAEVAKAGFKAMMDGKLYIIPGWKNKLLAFSTRILPSRHAILSISYRISKSQKK